MFALKAAPSGLVSRDAARRAPSRDSPRRAIGADETSPLLDVFLSTSWYLVRGERADGRHANVRNGTLFSVVFLCTIAWTASSIPASVRCSRTKPRRSKLTLIKTYGAVADLPLEMQHFHALCSTFMPSSSASRHRLVAGADLRLVQDWLRYGNIQHAIATRMSYRTACVNRSSTIPNASPEDELVVFAR